MTVVRSKCPTYLGISGLVVQETTNTFNIVTRDDKLQGLAPPVPLC